MRSLYKILPSRTIQTCLSLWERCRAATERACISHVLPPVCLMRTNQRPALSVICFANASSPKGRAEKPVRTAHLTHQANSYADLFACCSFRHGLRRATFLKEEGINSYPLLFAGFWRFSPLGRLRLRRGRREVFSFSSVDFSTVFCSALVSAAFF